MEISNTKSLKTQKDFETSIQINTEEQIPEEQKITMDVDPYNSDFWFKDQADFMKCVELDRKKQAKFVEFAIERRATGPLSKRITPEEEKANTDFIESEFRRAELSTGYLEYIDNDPDGTCNDSPLIVFLHGLLGNVFEFKPYLEFFKGKVRCISIATLGHEKYFPKPADINLISPKTFGDLIIELVTQKLGFKRCILIGFSFGGILSQPFAYHNPDVVAGVGFMCCGTITPHIGFIALNETSYGIMSQTYKGDWETVKKKVNDKKFQEEFRKVSEKAIKSYYLAERFSKGKLTPIYYQIPKDPYEQMVAFAYCRTSFRTIYEVGKKLPKILKMFCWGENDLVSQSEVVYESAYEHAKGDLQLKSNSEFFERIRGVNYWSATQSAKDRIYGVEEESSFDAKLSEIKADPEYFVKRQIEHCHGFQGEGHNAHIKRSKFIIPAVFEYYKDVLLIEHIKSCQAAKI